MKDNNKLKFVKNVLLELKLRDEISSWSKKELADYLIQHVWGNTKLNKIGSKTCAVLDRVIEELFEQQEEIDKDNLSKKILKDLSDDIEKSIKDNRNNVKKKLDCCGGNCGCH